MHALLPDSRNSGMFEPKAFNCNYGKQTELKVYLEVDTVLQTYPSQNNARL